MLNTTTITNKVNPIYTHALNNVSLGVVLDALSTSPLFRVRIEKPPLMFSYNLLAAQL